MKEYLDIVDENGQPTLGEELFVLANLSLIPHTGIPSELFCTWCNLENFDTINNLAVEGWLRVDETRDYLSLHPIVGEIGLQLIKNKPIYIYGLLSKIMSLYAEDADFSQDHLQTSAEYAAICMTLSQRIVKSKISDELAADFLSKIPTLF